MPLDIFIEGCIIDPGLHHARSEVTSVHDFRQVRGAQESEIYLPESCMSLGNRGDGALTELALRGQWQSALSLRLGDEEGFLQRPTCVN
jgi:hypothetical protein